MHFKFSTTVFTLLALAGSTVTAREDIVFNGHPRAISDLGPDTTLVVGGSPAKATFTYSVAKKTGNVRVTLGDNGIAGDRKEVAVLDENFDANAANGFTLDLNAVNVALKTSSYYFIRMQNKEGQDSQTGAFTILGMKENAADKGSGLKQETDADVTSGASQPQYVCCTFMGAIASMLLFAY